MIKRVCVCVCVCVCVRVAHLQDHISSSSSACERVGEGREGMDGRRRGQDSCDSVDVGGCERRRGVLKHRCECGEGFIEIGKGLLRAVEQRLCLREEGTRRGYRG